VETHLYLWMKYFIVNRRINEKESTQKKKISGGSFEFCPDF